ncbi:hypothetical protein [Amycolatopsis anabasis]|uniref:hypothetical protein n=1 Tax=Amycolatopsis anabasis TaxID=1840409 RepID=UPI00131AEF3C|nr:hypothetical protein [Amycolatopsis anabasis]
MATATAGCAGVYFTWLSGAQGRRHAEQLADRAESAAERTRVREQRRDAYLAVLRLRYLRRKQLKYRSQNRQEDLRNLERSYPPGDHFRMTMEARIGLSLFGSPEAAELFEEWAEIRYPAEKAREAELYQAFLTQVRRELGNDLILSIPDDQP